MKAMLKMPRFNFFYNYLKYTLRILKYRVYTFLVFICCFAALTLYITSSDLKNNNSTLPRYTWLEKKQNLSQFITGARFESNVTLCSPVTKVLLGVVSSPANKIQRKAIRSSWQGSLPSSWKILFAIGRAQDANLEQEVKEEQNLHHDIIKLDVEENYINLTLKVSLLLKWVAVHCSQAEILLKVDDDVFINRKTMNNFIMCCSISLNNMYNPQKLSDCERWEPQNLVGHFIDPKTRKYESYIAAGYLYSGVAPNRNPDSKWYLSHKLYSEDTLPNFLSGVGYLLSINLIPHMLDKAKDIPLINLEDVYITGLVMKKAMNLKLNHVDGWNRFRPWWNDPCLYSTQLIVHGLSPDELLAMSEAVHQLKTCGLINQLFSHLNSLFSLIFPRVKM